VLSSALFVCPSIELPLPSKGGDQLLDVAKVVSQRLDGFVHLLVYPDNLDTSQLRHWAYGIPYFVYPITPLGLSCAHWSPPFLLRYIFEMAALAAG
jgi:hypothetical protein